MTRRKRQEGRCRYWEELAAPAIREFAAEAVTIVPTAATEQHGNHLATGTDKLLNEALQARVVAEPPEGEHLILPTLPLGASDHHLAFGGTWSLPPVLYTEVLVSALRRLLGQGHRRIFVLNSHGGNQSPLQTALAELANEAQAEGALIAGASYWSLAESRWREVIPELKESHMGHACELETSMMMVVFPEGVLKKPARDVPFARCLREGWSAAIPIDGMSREGAIGYPRAAKKQTGEKLLEEAAAVLRGFLSDFATMPLPESLRAKKGPGPEARDKNL